MPLAIAVLRNQIIITQMEGIVAVVFLTSNPQALLNKFKQKIRQTEAKGKITTWSVDSDGDFTHDATNWTKAAWFRPVVSSDRLSFNIIKPQGVNITTTVYGYYHGHLIETFLNHFDNDFTSGSATAQPTTGDLCTA